MYWSLYSSFSFTHTLYHGHFLKKRPISQTENMQLKKRVTGNNIKLHECVNLVVDKTQWLLDIFSIHLYWTFNYWKRCVLLFLNKYMQRDATNIFIKTLKKFLLRTTRSIENLFNPNIWLDNVYNWKFYSVAMNNYDSE